MADSQFANSPTAGRKGQFGGYDKLVQMEKEKRELVRALDINKKRISTGMDILKKKHAAKVAAGEFKFTAAQATHVQVGDAKYSVEDFRQPAARRHPQKWPKKFDINDIDAKTITDPNMIRIREQNIKNTLCKKKIGDIRLQRQRQEQLNEEKKFKKLPAIEKKKMPRLNVPPSMLPNRYIRGELPCTIEHGINGQYLSWAAPLDNLDYEFYLPIFFDGLQCKQNPARFLARQGIEDLLFAARGYPNRIKACVKMLVRPLRNALSKFDVDILLGVLKALQQLVTCNEGVGATLMPYSKQFLAPIATFMDLNTNTGDRMDYGQRHNNDVGVNVLKTLELMEEHGGSEAYKSIKFSIPLYESCMRSKVIQRAGVGDGSNTKTAAASGSKPGSSKSTGPSKAESVAGSKIGSLAASGTGSRSTSKPNSGGGVGM
eukprot:GSChrysophyteH2.ASY1.ANO1.164.1 assembled CDS